MKLKDIMNTYPVTVETGTDLALARHTMAWADVRHVPIVDHKGKVLGIVSERDVLRHLSAEHDHGPDPHGPFPLVDAIMTGSVQTASPDDSVTEAAARLVDSNIGCLPVTEKGVLVGIVTRTDVLRGEVRQAMAAKETSSTLVARDIMSADPTTIMVDDYLLNAAGRMQTLGARHLPVVNGAGDLVGILSDRDVRAGIGDPTRAHDDERRIALNLLRVADAMTRSPYTVLDDASLPVIAGLFVNHRLSAAPVVDRDNNLVGVVSYLDLLRAGS